MIKDASELDRLCITTIRMLAVDMVEAARSGHPGLPLGAAPAAYTLFSRHLKFNPKDPDWPDRDRFILSAGHGSALLYALLFLAGYDLPLDQLKRFRQWGSPTPGHPEYGLTPGVEATTGPLGQGFAMGVGLALAESFLAASFNRLEFPVVDHYTYALVSDGDLMEGVASEAASLAGALNLGRLIYLYDDNHISIEGDTDLAFTEDVRARFSAYGWHVSRIEDGEDVAAIDAALAEAKAETSRPSLIMIRSHIGFGSPKQDDPSAHGEPLGPEAVAATRRYFGWPDEPFHIPDEALNHLRRAGDEGGRREAEWRELMVGYAQAHPPEAETLETILSGRLPRGWDAQVPVFGPDDGPIATRAASGRVMNALVKGLPHLVGGSADLAPSTKTILIGYGDYGFGRDCGSAGEAFTCRAGRNLHFGVREHAMGAVVNGLALHGGLIPYGATFLVFSDYLRPAIRLAALMQTKAVFVFSHDSIALGEDGPTHQPVEHLASLRAIPGLTVIRPADANETAAAWRLAVQRRGPTALILSRQKLPVLDPRDFPAAPDPSQGVGKGAYALIGGHRRPEVILIATGAEVHLAIAASQRLAVQGIVVRVVSMPSWEIFAEQSEEYRNKLLPPETTARLAIEAGSPLGWERWVGSEGGIIGVDRFGASAPGETVLREYGFTVENVVERAKALLGR